ncbi:MAG: CoB--CoM heterodisulfide reductase iron-sulfur subunit B family protein [Promethearchaeota archaeon]
MIEISNKHRYALFLGCTIPSRYNNYDAAARKCADVLGIEFVDMQKEEGAGCCGPIFLRSADFDTWISMGAKNLVIAERLNLDIVALCNGCFGTLREVNHLLKHDEQLRERVNTVLSESDLPEFKGTIEVYHFIKMLEKYGLENIERKMSLRFEGLKSAVFYGCHSLKPSEAAQVDNPERPHILEDLVNITGAKAVEWDEQLKCCGGPILAINEKLAEELAKKKLDSAKAAGADCTVIICPFCEVMFDVEQVKIESDLGIKYDLPALFYPQLLGLTLGLRFNELGFQFNKVSAEKIRVFLKPL